MPDMYFQEKQTCDTLIVRKGSEEGKRQRMLRSMLSGNPDRTEEPLWE